MFSNLENHVALGEPPEGHELTELKVSHDQVWDALIQYDAQLAEDYWLDELSERTGFTYFSAALVGALPDALKAGEIATKIMRNAVRRLMKDPESTNARAVQSALNRYYPDENVLWVLDERPALLRKQAS